MSVLEVPRLTFRGRITWDPIVTNNYAQQYDEDGSETVFSPTVPDVAAFRAAAIAAVTDGTIWNTDGTHRSSFFETRVVGVDLGEGPVGEDPILGAPVSLLGMLVDLEPYGTYTSQLFFDAMSFGIDGGCQVMAKRHTRMTARYINFARFLSDTVRLAKAGFASVVWQTSFRKEDLAIAPHGSSTLSRFLQAFDDPDVQGLTVRWNAYRTSYFDTLDSTQLPALQRQLQAKLKLGGFQPNPARSEVAGVLGLWRKGEPASEPGDRALLSPPSQAPYTKPPILIATAHCRASANTLTLDLSNSIPEVDVEGTKANLGDLVVTAQSPGPVIAIRELCRIPYALYCRDAYDATAGIVTVAVPGAETAVKGMTLGLSCPDKTMSGVARLVERPLRALPDTPNLYMDEGESGTITVRVFDRGLPVQAGGVVTMWRTDAGGDVTGSPLTAPIGPGGIASFDVHGVKGDICGYIFSADPAEAAPAGIDTQRTPYAYVRTLPADQGIAAKPPEWDNVHRYVLRNWEAMAPCMDNWLRLGDERQVKSFAPILKRLTDKANFEGFLFMPVTRDMTAGERTLLYNFLDGPPAPSGVAATGAPVGTMTAASRSMRRG